MSDLLFETDWSATRPVYYNEATGAAGRNVNDVIEFAEAELDPEGFNAYLATGYSLFEHTPVRGVRFLPPSARLWREADGRLRVEEVPVDIDGRLEQRFTESEVFDLLRARVQRSVAARSGDVVIPTSGGYDSRLLNLMVAEPSRIRSFTFGPTARQWDSVEVARARALAEMLGTRWEWIELGPFHSRLDEWDQAFGPVVHAHGMYQLDFYSKLRSRLVGEELVLSGLAGDGLAGKWDALAARPLRGPRDVVQLIHTGATKADPSASLIPYRSTRDEEYFERHREHLKSHRRRMMEAIRFRILLTHYLLRVPRLYGLDADAPYLDLDVATAMMSLSDERRLRRRWEREYLASRGALFEHVRGDGRYWLYWPVMRAQPLVPLDQRVLAEVVRPEYVRWINRTVSWRGLWYEGYERVSRRRGFRRAANFLSARGLRQRRLEAYHAYMTLWPIQRLLQKRDAARLGEPVTTTSVSAASVRGV